MKSFLHGLVIAMPLTAIIIYFALSGRQEVVTQQRSHEIQQEIQSLEFQRSFADAWQSFDSPPTVGAQAEKKVDVEIQQADRATRLAQLRQQREAFTSDIDKNFQQLESDLGEMRSAMQEAEAWE